MKYVYTNEVGSFEMITPAGDQVTGRGVIDCLFDDVAELKSGKGIWEGT